MSAGTGVTATPPDREALRSLLGDELLAVWEQTCARWRSAGAELVMTDEGHARFFIAGLAKTAKVCYTVFCPAWTELGLVRHHAVNLVRAGRQQQ